MAEKNIKNSKTSRLIDDEISLMLKDNEVDKDTLFKYLKRVREYDEDFDLFVPLYYRNSIYNYVMEKIYDISSEERTRIRSMWSDVFDEDGFLNGNKLAERIYNDSKDDILDNLTIGQICQLNNLYLRDIMRYGDGEDDLDYEFLRKYMETTDEMVAFADVLDSEWDCKEKDASNCADPNMSPDDGMYAYVSVMKKYNDSLGISMNVDFACEVAITIHEECYNHITCDHINSFVETELWDSIKDRAKRYLSTLPMCERMRKIKLASEMNDEIQS